MRKYTKSGELLRAVCNCCGKELKVENGILKEGIFSAENIWGYFSDKDMEVHSLDLCESCYDSWVSGFAVPAEVQEATEIPGV